MARIKLDLPETLGYETEIQIRISEINYGGHLGNDAILSQLHEARLRYLESFGYSELDAAGVSIIMSDCAIVYKSEGFYGQTVKIEVGAADFSRTGFDLYYRLHNKDTEKLLAEAKTGIVCFDYRKRKVVGVPEILKQQLLERGQSTNQ